MALRIFTLGSAQLDAGKKLIARLTRIPMEVTDARWIHLAETDEWQLVIVTPFVQRKGPIAAYRLVQSVLSETDPEICIRLDNVRIVAGDARIVGEWNGNPALRAISAGG